jgi:hypothetical protein
MNPTIITALGLGVAWLIGIAGVMYKIGRFEERVTNKIEMLDDGRKENRDTIKELRVDVQRRFDDLYKEIVKPNVRRS